MALVPYTVTALAESDAEGTDGKNIVVGAVVTLTDTNGNAVNMYDDEAGSNGSTSKVTGSNGQVTIYFEQGEYTLSVNGVESKIILGKKSLTTTSELINSTRQYRDGDIVTTYGFNSVGDYGGGDWIKTSSTNTPSQEPKSLGLPSVTDANGSVWNYISRPASLLALGAAGNGSTDDAATIKIWLSVAGELFAPKGDYAIDFQGANTDGVKVDLVKTTKVTCSSGVRFIAKNSLDGDMIRMEVPDSGPTDSELVVEWDGGEFDQRGQANSTSVPFSTNYPPANLGTSATTDGLSIIGIYDTGSGAAQGVKSATISNARFIASNLTWESAGGDSGINVATANDTVFNCYFKGNRDLGIYQSSDNLDGTGLGLGQNFKAYGNTFENCMFSVSSKRGADNITITSNTFKDCIQWIGIEPFTRRSNGVCVTGNVGSGYIFGIDVGSSDGVSVTGNVLKDAGILLENGSAPTVNFTSPEAITLRGCLNSSVTNNVIFEKIAEYSIYSVKAVNLESQDVGAGDVDTDNCLITSNTIKDVDVPIFAQNLLNNTFSLNKVTGTNVDQWNDASSKSILRDGGELTISSGEITIFNSFHEVDTEGNQASDDLDTVNGGTDKQRLILKANNSTRTVVLKDLTGNLQLNGDFSLTNQADLIELIYDADTAFWYEITRSPNAA